MLSVETAKAVVDVPSPYTGTIVKLHAKAGETVQTGHPLVEFDLPAGTTAKASSSAPKPEAQAPSAGGGQGMVVGHMASIDGDFVDRAIGGGGTRGRRERLRAAPAVRILAKKLGVQLAACRATGRHGLITVDDVLAAANVGPGRARTAAPTVAGLTDADRLRGP